MMRAKLNYHHSRGRILCASAFHVKREEERKKEVKTRAIENYFFTYTAELTNGVECYFYMSKHFARGIDRVTCGE